MISYKEQLKNKTLDEFGNFDYLSYYNNYKLQYYFIRYLRNRELCFLPSKKTGINRWITRNIRAHNVESFQFWIRFVNAFKHNRLINMYYSLAEFVDGIPYRDTRRGNLEEDWDDWNLNAEKNIISYDMLIDIDCDSFDNIYYGLESSREIKKFFDFHNIPYRLRFSGRGFHFIIPFEYFNMSYGKDFMVYIRKASRYLYDNISEMVDLSVSDCRRVTKLPMSISIYDEGNFICYPVENLDNFNIDSYRAENFKYDHSIPMDIIHNAGGDLSFFNVKI